MAKKRKAKPPEKGGRKYQPPVNIPLDFDRAIDGLLAVSPKKKGRKKREKG